MIFVSFWLRAAFYSALLLFIYFLVLRNRNAHQVSRFYLLVTSTLPLFLPIIDLSAWLPASGGGFSVNWLQEIVIGGSSNAVNTLSRVSWWQLYMGISCCLLAGLLLKLFLFIRSIAKHRVVVEGQLHIIYNAPYTGSWLHYLLLAPNATEPAIVAHEAAHIRYRHSYDLLLLNTIGCFTWLNPFFFLLRKELRLVHEFQADEAANTDLTTYANTLLAQVFQTNTHTFIHTFSQHPLKRRIMMLHQKNNPRKTGYRLAIAGSLLMTVAASGIFLQSCKDKIKEPQPASTNEMLVTSPNGEVMEVKLVTTAEDSASYNDMQNIANPLKEAQVRPVFNGDMMQYLSEHIHYPDEAKRKNIQGKVIVSFVIDNKGVVRNAKVVRSPNDLLAAEALRVIESMPAWKPGMQDGKVAYVQMYQPITFKLQ